MCSPIASTASKQREVDVDANFFSPFCLVQGSNPLNGTPLFCMGLLISTNLTQTILPMHVHKLIS